MQLFLLPPLGHSGWGDEGAQLGVRQAGPPPSEGGWRESILAPSGPGKEGAGQGRSGRVRLIAGYACSTHLSERMRQSQA